MLAGFVTVLDQFACGSGSVRVCRMKVGAYVMCDTGVGPFALEPVLLSSWCYAWTG